MFWFITNSTESHLELQQGSFQPPALNSLHLGLTLGAPVACHAEKNGQTDPCPPCTPGLGLASLQHHGLGHCATVLSCSSTTTSPNPRHAHGPYCTRHMTTSGTPAEVCLSPLLYSVSEGEPVAVLDELHHRTPARHRLVCPIALQQPSNTSSCTLFTVDRRPPPFYPSATLPHHLLVIYTP